MCALVFLRAYVGCRITNAELPSLDRCVVPACSSLWKNGRQKGTVKATELGVPFKSKVGWWK